MRGLTRLTKDIKDVFTNVHQPWLFQITHTVPGPLMMAEAAFAAYKTVPEGFKLDSLHTHFMLAPKGTRPLVYKVQRLSQGRRFAVRLVTIEQDEKPVVTITASFVSGARWTGRAMKHSESRRTNTQIDEITLDDFEPSRTHLGPFMKFERLPHVHQGQLSRRQSVQKCSSSAVPQNPSTSIAPVVAKISPRITAPEGSPAHLLAIIYLSDYHVMDCPLGLHKVTIGESPIGDHTRTKLPNEMKIMTSLNHVVHFHAHEGFRADEHVYVEATSPWAQDGRAMIHSRIFSHQGLLIATCVQEVRVPRCSKNLFLRDLLTK